MKLEGIHHITCITGDAPRNLDFYTRVLGLRLVKKTVNQDDPTVYHLFYADEQGSPGADLTFFEYPGADRGQAGGGMVHRITFRVKNEDAITFWEKRLADEEIYPVRAPGSLIFDDPEGLNLELAVVESPDAPLIAEHPEIPHYWAIEGFDSVRAYAYDPEKSRTLLEQTLGGTPTADAEWEIRGDERGGFYRYDPAPASASRPGAGTVHHVAWATQLDEQEAWRERVDGAGYRPTPVIDRFWFHSVYFREPSGVLFELATIGPGFATDEDPEHLGESLVLPPNFEHLRSRIEPVLTPLPNPREHWAELEAKAKKKHKAHK
jgi:glyoxalase family protein